MHYSQNHQFFYHKDFVHHSTQTSQWMQVHLQLLGLQKEVRERSVDTLHEGQSVACQGLHSYPWCQLHRVIHTNPYNTSIWTVFAITLYKQLWVCKLFKSEAAFSRQSQIGSLHGMAGRCTHVWPLRRSKGDYAMFGTVQAAMVQEIIGLPCLYKLACCKTK